MYILFAYRLPQQNLFFTSEPEILHTQFIQLVMIMIMTKCETRKKITKDLPITYATFHPPQVRNCMGQAPVTFPVRRAEKRGCTTWQKPEHGCPRSREKCRKIERRSSNKYNGLSITSRSYTLKKSSASNNADTIKFVSLMLVRDRQSKNFVSSNDNSAAKEHDHLMHWKKGKNNAKSKLRQ